MLGGYSSDLVQAQTVVPQQHKIPYIGGGGAASAIYARGFTTIFSLLDREPSVYRMRLHRGYAGAAQTAQAAQDGNRVREHLARA